MTTTYIEARRGTTAVLVVLAVAALLLAALATGPAAEANDHGNVDAADGFTPDPDSVARGTVTDDLAVQFRLRYDEPGDDRGTLVRNLRDAGDTIFLQATFDADGGTSGWHTHPGPALVTVVEGSLEVTNASDCVTRTYGAGETWLDPGAGNVHIATNTGAQDTLVYALFLGVPADTGPTQPVPPADC